MTQDVRLHRVKLAHTLIWVILAGSIFALPFCGWTHRFAEALAITVVIGVECLVLALNHGRCPLTDVAAQYTADRAANFDIYLPLPIARHNKTIFGLLFVVGEAVVAGCGLAAR